MNVVYSVLNAYGIPQYDAFNFDTAFAWAARNMIGSWSIQTIKDGVPVIERSKHDIESARLLG